MAYFKSEDVKVFPCAYRGYRESSAEALDPSARSFTEYNFSNIYSNISANKPSYVISYNTTDDILKCIIGGYYFEISNVSTYSFKWLGIQLSQVNNTADNNDSKSVVLVPVGTGDINVNYLDSEETGEFLGVRYSNEETNCSYSLQVFDADGNIYERSKRLEDSFGHGAGKYSIYSADDKNASEANGQHSVALGRNNTAAHDYSTAIGNNLETSSNYQVLLGNGGAAKFSPNENIAIQMVNDGQNIISISKAGDIKTDGFEVTDGSLKTLGSLTAYEQLIVKSGGASITGQVDITGDTNITGITTITGDTTVNGKLNITDNTTLAKKLTVNDTATIAKKLTVSSGGADITGKSKIDGTLTSTDKLTVENNGADISGDVNINGTLAAKDGLTIGTAENEANALIYGNTTVQGKLTATNNVELTNGSTKILVHTVGRDSTTLTTLQADTIKLDGNTETGNLKLNEINFKDKAKLETYSFEGNDIVPSSSPAGFTIKNTNALANLQGGLHLGGMLTVYNPAQSNKLETGIAIFDTDNAKTLKAKIKTDGTAYFAQKIILGGGKEDLNIPYNADVSTYLDYARTAGCSVWADTPAHSETGNLDLPSHFIAVGNAAIGGDTYIEGNITTGQNSHLYVGRVIKLNENNNNGVIASTYNTPSDIRLKQNIKNYEAPKSILDLNVKEFEYINDAAHKKHIGCIAQELQEICPEIVSEDADGYLSVEENKLVYLLLNEVKKLKKEINKLKGE